MQEQITSNAEKLTKKVIVNRISDIPGGVSMTLADLVAGNVVMEGTPLSAPSSGKRTVCKQAPILDGSTTTVYRVRAGQHQFKVGDILFQVVGGAAYAISSIATEVGTVTENGEVITYDTLTVGTALESAASGTFIYQSSVSAGEGADTGALENAADVITKSAWVVPSNTQVIYMKDALLRADVQEGFIGPLHLATLDVKEVKY